MAIDLGFNARMERLIITTDEDVGHVFTIISDSTGYCILDQLEYPRCFLYGGVSE